MHKEENMNAGSGDDMKPKSGNQSVCVFKYERIQKSLCRANFKPE